MTTSTDTDVLAGLAEIINDLLACRLIMYVGILRIRKLRREIRFAWIFLDHLRNQKLRIVRIVGIEAFAGAEHFFSKYGSITVFVGRLLPVIRTFIALPAGIARMPQLRFHIYTFLGSWPWCFVLAYVGMKLGQQWDSNPEFKHAFHRFHLAVEVVLLAGIIWFLWTHLSRKRLSQA